MKRERTSHRLRWALGLVGAVAVALVIIAGHQAMRARTALRDVASDFETLSAQLRAGDTAAARSTLEEAQQHARVAVDHTHGPLWSLLGGLPGVGENVQAVQVVAEVADDLTGDVLPDAVTAVEGLSPDSLRPVGGSIDLEPIRRIERPVVRAAAGLSHQADRVASVDVTQLADPVAKPLVELRNELDEAARVADRASRTVQVLPPMLGAEGRRSYVLVFQNNAEVRATGGIPGAFALLTADHGRIALGLQSDAAGLGRFETPPVPITRAEQRIFGPAMGIFPQDVNFTPDFPRSAGIVRGMWKKRTGRDVDGVVSVDPVALSYLLEGTGPVKTVGGVRITGDNAVRLLLSEVYARIPDAAQQNDFFNAAARSVFHALTSGVGNPRAVLDGLTRAVGEHRVLVWSAHPEEQRLLAPTAMAGALSNGAERSPLVGVYLNASLPYKLDYYLRHEVSVESIRCEGARQHLGVTLEMSSRVPRSYRSLSHRVAPDAPLFRRGTILDTVYFVAPAAGSSSRLTVDGEDQTFETYAMNGRQVLATSVALRPGEHQTLEVSMVAGRGQTGQPVLRVTPGARGDGTGTVGESSCS